tara:strand:- start:6 stop:875 length:870 start_codon:yes stop_codon:yes gene_type:complete
MAVDKNFVVKNGLEVNSDLILADSTNKRVGIGSTLPDFTLDVIGGIGATDIFISGLSTFVGFSTFQDSIGVQKDITIAGISTVVGVATFRDNVFIDGDLNVAGDINFDEISGRNLNITGFSTLVGFSTFKSDIFVAGVGTFASDISVLGNLNVTGDLSYDEVTGRNIKITGLSTFVGLSSFVSGVYINGITTTAGAGGITTTGGDLFVGGDLNVKGDADIAGVLTASSFSGSATIGLSSEGTFVGAGVSLINMASSNQTAIDVSPVSSGVATVTITPGVSLGLAIALGG